VRYNAYVNPASSLLDRISYTASLVTNPSEVDNLLDTLRDVSAHINPSQPLSSYEEARLLELQKNLETYLVTQEKIRSFTPESLRLQIDLHMQGRSDRKSFVRLCIVLAVSITTAVSAATLLHLSDVPQRIQVGGATTFSLLTVGAAWLFLTALPAFKSELRRAFLVICLGVTLLGLSLLEQPILEIFDLRQYPIVSILYPLPILLAATLFHAGDALYVRLIGSKNFWTTVKPVLLGVVIFSLITWLLPHPPTTESETVHDVAAMIWGWITVMPVASAIILPMAVRSLPELYKTSARYLFWAMFPIIAVCTYQYAVRVVAGPFMTGPVAYALFLLVTIMGLGLLVAGYTFNKVSRY